MSGGKKFDTDKPRMDLLSTKALRQLAEVMSFGAKKYDANNWRKGIAWSRVYGAVQRHLTSWNDGETQDPETKLNHLAHAMAGIMFLLEYAETHPELDDRFKAEPTKPGVADVERLYRDLCKHVTFKQQDINSWDCTSCGKNLTEEDLFKLGAKVQSLIEYERKLNSKR